MPNLRVPAANAFIAARVRNKRVIAEDIFLLCQLGIELCYLLKQNNLAELILIVSFLRENNFCCVAYLIKQVACLGHCKRVIFYRRQLEICLAVYHQHYIFALSYYLIREGLFVVKYCHDYLLFFSSFLNKSSAISIRCDLFLYLFLSLVSSSIHLISSSSIVALIGFFIVQRKIPEKRLFERKCLISFGGASFRKPIKHIIKYILTYFIFFLYFIYFII